MSAIDKINRGYESKSLGLDKSVWTIALSD
jgi:hypothetical protein